MNVLPRACATFLLVLWAMMIAPTAFAADLTGIYAQSTLEHWEQRYARSTQRILDEVIRPVLLDSERRRLERVRLDTPTHAQGDMQGRPLAFYAPWDGRRVVMPVFSLKFLDDLCTAYAWLQINGYSLETITDYTAMLRYGDVRATPEFAPLSALGVPEDALEDARVDKLALGHFVTARTFILLHELGHLYHGHRGGTAAQKRHNETEADRFAAEVMARTPLPPLGSLVFFMADVSWAGYPSSDQDTHPISGTRLRTLAAQLEAPTLASRLIKLAAMLEDPDIRRSFVAVGKATTLASLAPRRPDQLSSATAIEVNAAFSGSYLGQVTQVGDQAFPVRVDFKREGDRVWGEYRFALGVGKIDGRVSGNVMNFAWEWADSYGRGRFESTADGKAFSGRWGYHDSADNAGSWNGTAIVPH
ncbi:ImmA/IrrE family metallo-endopeptidase [Sedimenticola selenatireducens]|uniref:ImmA/IrrE family metallo-endopeptidase n=1 Tax=Sedimenticola selenatireducens TaxID=191960 RepID=UPI002AAB7757|nr:ImmA/IrrE family metallo-endopeptidase [Sedimenticola selenatireducens]